MVVYIWSAVVSDFDISLPQLQVQPHGQNQQINQAVTQVLDFNPTTPEICPYGAV